MRHLLKRNLLKRDQPALRALVTIEELREVFGLVSVDPDDDPGFTPGLFK